MEQRPFGPTGRPVPVIGQGTWYEAEPDRAAAVAALRRGLDLGMTHIDTAEMYGAGAAEEWVGEAIAGRRREVFLASKVLPHNASRAGTVAACHRSLARLRTDRLDCYLLHWRGTHSLEETVAAFEQLQREGKWSSPRKVDRKFRVVPFVCRWGDVPRRGVSARAVVDDGAGLDQRRPRRGNRRRCAAPAHRPARAVRLDDAGGPSASLAENAAALVPMARAAKRR